MKANYGDFSENERQFGKDSDSEIFVDNKCKFRISKGCLHIRTEPTIFQHVYSILVLITLLLSPLFMVLLVFRILIAGLIYLVSSITTLIYFYSRYMFFKFRTFNGYFDNAKQFMKFRNEKIGSDDFLTWNYEEIRHLSCERHTRDLFSILIPIFNLHIHHDNGERQFIYFGNKDACYNLQKIIREFTGLKVLTEKN